MSRIDFALVFGETRLRKVAVLSIWLAFAGLTAAAFFIVDGFHLHMRSMGYSGPRIEYKPAGADLAAALNDLVRLTVRYDAGQSGTADYVALTNDYGTFGVRPRFSEALEVSGAEFPRLSVSLYTMDRPALKVENWTACSSLANTFGNDDFIVANVEVAPDGRKKAGAPLEGWRPIRFDLGEPGSSMFSEFCNGLGDIEAVWFRLKVPADAAKKG